ncbi:hypothetical protein M3J09_009142 [Ascochyta lentis]
MIHNLYCFIDTVFEVLPKHIGKLSTHDFMFLGCSIPPYIQDASLVLSHPAHMPLRKPPEFQA